MHLATAAALLLMACSLEPAERPPPDPGRPLHPSILVLVPEGLDIGRAQTAALPGFEALAARGCTYHATVAPDASALSALATLLSTGQPAETTQGLEPTPNPTLPELLGRYGYHRAAWWGTDDARADTELSRGFSELREGGPEDLRSWIDAGPPSPFFALVHGPRLQQDDGGQALTRYSMQLLEVLALLDGRGPEHPTVVALTSTPSGGSRLPLFIAPSDAPTCGQVEPRPLSELSATLLELAEVPWDRAPPTPTFAAP